MRPDFSLISYNLQANWMEREESAPGVARRYLAYFTRLACEHDVFGSWFVGSRLAKLEEVEGDLVSVVEQDVTRDDYGEPSPLEGFSTCGLSRDRRQTFVFVGSAGSPLPSPYLSGLSFHTDYGVLPDQAFATYAIWRSICLATIASWEPLYCIAAPSTLNPFRRKGSWYWESWFTYVHPSLMHRIDVPRIPVVERTPDGGLLLAAADEVFAVDNPDHLEAARRIADATAPLDAVMPPLL